MSKKKKRNMVIYDGQNNEMMTIRKFEQDGNDLLITGKIFGAMPMKARLRPEEARAAIKLLDFKTIFYLITLLLRPSSNTEKQIETD